MHADLVQVNKELRAEIEKSRKEIKRLRAMLMEVYGRLNGHDHELHILRKFARLDGPSKFNKVDGDYRKETGYNH